MSNHPAFEIRHPDAKSSILILCDHASNAVPNTVNGGTLGLPEADMNRHIAYDVGARGVVEHLSDILDAHAVFSRFSRLVIDPNRGEDDPTLLMKLYDGSIIPGNRDADDAEKERRLNLFHRPYHQAVKAQIDHMISEGRVPALVSVHSFTPKLRNKPMRPWHLGVLWDKDDRLVHPFIKHFANDQDIIVGNNEPYSGELQGDTLYFHGTQRGLPHILIEIRHDLIDTPDGQRKWAECIAPAIWMALNELQQEVIDG